MNLFIKEHNLLVGSWRQQVYGMPSGISVATDVVLVGPLSLPPRFASISNSPSLTTEHHCLVPAPQQHLFNTHDTKSDDTQGQKRQQKKYKTPIE